jgi:hypothetical protein
MYRFSVGDDAVAVEYDCFKHRLLADPAPNN